MRLCLDELYTPLIAAELRKLGHDAISVHDRPALIGLPDAELLALMSAERRALVTANVADFMILVSRWALEGAEHAGLLLTSDAAMPRSRNTVGRYVRALDRYLRAHPADHALRDGVDWLQPAAAKRRR
jgi:hypothetical protein